MFPKRRAKSVGALFEPNFHSDAVAFPNSTWSSRICKSRTAYLQGLCLSKWWNIHLLKCSSLLYWRHDVQKDYLRYAARSGVLLVTGGSGPTSVRGSTVLLRGRGQRRSGRKPIRLLAGYRPLAGCGDARRTDQLLPFLQAGPEGATQDDHPQIHEEVVHLKGISHPLRQIAIRTSSTTLGRSPLLRTTYGLTWLYALTPPCSLTSASLSSTSLSPGGAVGAFGSAFHPAKTSTRLSQ